MRILYVDCFSGISGDMMVAALADLGVTPSTFEWKLSKIELGDFHLHFERQTRQRIAGVKFDVHPGLTHVESAEHSHDKDGSRRPDHSTDNDANPQGSGHYDHDHHESDQDDQSSAHSHGESTLAKSLPHIRDLIRKSDLSDFVKRHSVSIFQRIGEAEAKTHGIPIEQVHFHEIGALDSIVDIVLATVGIESLGIERVYFSSLY